MFLAGWTGALPPAVAAVAASLLGSQSSVDPPPLVRVVCQVGPQRWAVLHCARLEGDEAGLAVIIDQPRPGEVRELLCQTRGLSPRERVLFDLVVQGSGHRPDGRAARHSTHTVQDHLEAIFAKVGVRSRRQLTSRLLAALQS